MKKLTIAAAIVCVSCIAAPGVHAQEAWYKEKLMSGQQYVTDFTLAAGESKTITVPSDKEVHVGFKADVSFEKGQEYFNRQENPIELDLGDVTVRSIFGASSRCTPKNGTIQAEIKNNGQEAFNVVIYKEE